MPELGFYFDESDISDVVQRCFDEGAFLVPDRNYSEPKHDEIRSLVEFRKYRENGGPNLFFIVSYKYFECPFEMRPVMKEGAQKYFISQKNGGPTIDLFCPRVFIKDGTEFIPAGLISHHSTYWNTKHQRMARPPESLKDLYKKLTKAIKERSTIAKSQHRAFLVGQGATSHLAAGSKLGGVFA